MAASRPATTNRRVPPEQEEEPPSAGFVTPGLFDANVECLRMFLCWSTAVRSGENQGLYLFLVLHLLNGACLFKMMRKALLKNNQASSTDGMRSISGPGR